MQWRSVRFASAEGRFAVNASVGLSEDGAPIVTEAAPTTDSVTHETNSPAEANSPVRTLDTVAGRYRV